MVTVLDEAPIARRALKRLLKAYYDVKEDKVVVAESVIDVSMGCVVCCDIE